MVRQGQGISPSDITVWGIYKDGSRKLVSITQSNTIFDSRAVGPQTVRVRIGSHEARFQTEVVALTQLTIASPTTKTVFKAGEDAGASWPGLEVRGDWGPMGSDRIATVSLQITGFNKDRAGRQTISVAYGGQTATFNVEVLALSSLELDRPPDKTDYVTGEAMDLAGIVLYGNYGTNPSNRIRELIPANQLTVSGYDANRVGRQQRVTVTVGGQSTNFFVNVAQASSAEAPGSSTPSGGDMAWTAVRNSIFGTSSIQDIAYGANTFVAGADGGRMAYSAGR